VEVTGADPSRKLMAEIGAIHNQPKADSEPHQAESTDHERDIAAVSVHRSGRNCGYNVLARRCYRRWILS
jgi:hypothetical protein